MAGMQNLTPSSALWCTQIHYISQLIFMLKIMKKKSKTKSDHLIDKI